MSLPPGPRAPAPINLARFARRPVETLLRWHERYGDVFTVRYAGFGTGVYVADPGAIRDMFTGDQADLRAGEANSILEPVVGPQSVLVLDGPAHLRQRKLLLPPFQGAHVAAYREVIRDVAEREVAGWRSGERIVLRERMRALTFEVICDVVFGVTDERHVARLRGALLPLIDASSTFLLPAPLRADLGGFSPGGRFVRRRRAADALLFAEIERRRGQPDLHQRDDVLSLLLRARDERGEPMSDAELRDELFTLLAAGHETTATALAFAFDLLMRNPRAMARLCEQLDEDAYVDATVKETLRLRPVIDGAERTLTAPREIGGWLLPAGVKVYPAILLVQRREDIYPRAHEFRPERFLEGAPSYGWIPFGGGIRRCIGAALAQAEMAEVLRVVLARVTLVPERAEPEPVVLRGITLVPRHGVKARVARTPARATAGALAA